MCTGKGDNFFALYDIHGKARVDSYLSSYTFIKKEKEKSVLTYAKLASEENFPWVQVGSPFLQPEKECELPNISKSTVQPTIYFDYVTVLHVPLLPHIFLKIS